MSLELAYVNPDFGQDWRIISPQVVGDRMAELDRQISQLNTVIGADENTGRIADRPGGTQYIREWASFVGEWRVWYVDHQDWLSRFTSGVVRQAEEYAARFNRFEERLVAMNLNIATGNPTREEVEPGASRSMLLWGAIGVAAIFGVAWLLKEGRGVAREARAYFPERTSSGPSYDLGPAPAPTFRGLRRLRA